MLVLHRKLRLPGTNQPDSRLDPRDQVALRTADIILGQIRADDLPADKIKIEVELAPRTPFALGFMLLLKPFALAEDLKASTIHDQMNRIRSGRFARRVQSQALAPTREGGKIRHRDRNSQQGGGTEHQALGLTQRLLEDHSQGQTYLDRHAGVGSRCNPPNSLPGISAS
jgi:hypothetical protein